MLTRLPHAAIIQNTFVHQYFENTVPLSAEFKRVPDPQTKFEIGIYYRAKDGNGDITAISEAVQGMVKDGTWERITNFYANYNKTAPRLK